jgi:hypothetical protein
MSYEEEDTCHIRLQTRFRLLIAEYQALVELRLENPNTCHMRRRIHFI